MSVRAIVYVQTMVITPVKTFWVAIAASVMQAINTQTTIQVCVKVRL